VVSSGTHQSPESTPPDQARRCGPTRGAVDRLKRSPNQPERSYRLNGLPGRLEVRPADPYVLLNADEFTVCCRSCRWQSVPCGELVEARLAYSMHACSRSPIADHAEVVG